MLSDCDAYPRAAHEAHGPPEQNDLEYEFAEERTDDDGSPKVERDDGRGVCGARWGEAIDGPSTDLRNEQKRGP